MKQLRITQTITNRETAAVETYLNEVSKMHMISPQEEADIGRRIRLGDERAVDRLVGANLRFVVSVAKQHQNKGLPLGDLINEGNLGLIRAARKFDETRGFKFISYAVWWIRQSMLEALGEQSRMIRLPMNQVSRITKMNRALSTLEQREERLPTVAEMSEFLDMPDHKVADALNYSPRTASYDAPLTSEDNFSLLDRIAVEVDSPDAELLGEANNWQINALLQQLSNKEQQVIELSFGLKGERDLSAPEISEILDLCPERIRQIRNDALNKLRMTPGLQAILN